MLTGYAPVTAATDRLKRLLSALRQHAVAGFATGFLVLLLCVVLPATAHATPDAARIDALLSEHASPMQGLGATFVAEGAEHGIDPAFLVAIAGAESSFGAYLYSENGDVCLYNAFNWFYGPTWPESDFSSWADAIAAVAEGLSGSLYYGSGLYSVSAIAPRYCPEGTNEWIANVTAFMIELGGNPLDTRLNASLAVPATQPGLLELDGTVDLLSEARRVGDTMTARFTIVNNGDQPVTFDGITLAIRGPAGATRDMASRTAVVLQPGETHLVEATWYLDLVGTWRGWIQVDQNGVPSLIGSQVAFRFCVSLPHELRIRDSLRRADRLDLEDKPEATDN